MRTLALVFTLPLLLASCSQVAPYNPAALPFFNNSRPVALASGPTEAPLGTAVLLDGTDSYDPDEDELQWHWAVDQMPADSELPSNPFSTNDSRNAALTDVLLDVPGIYVFSLRVTDPDEAASYTTFVTVLSILDDSVPLADAGPNVAGAEGALVCADGSRSSDPRGRTPTYLWSVAVRPEASALTDGFLLGGDSPEVCFTPDVTGEYLLSLVVEAGGRSSPPDFVEVLVISTNQSPTALPSFSDGASCSSVALDGTSSTDPDGDALDYRWDLLLAPFGSRTPLGEAAFADSTAAAPVFYADVAGEYLAQLVVHDGEHISEPALLELELHPKTVNADPQVQHSEDVYIRRVPTNCWQACSPVEFTIDAVGTSDPDGDLVDVTWAVVSGDATLGAHTGLEVEVEIAPPAAGCTNPVPRNLVEIEVTATDCSGGTDVSHIVVAYDCG